MFTIPEAESTIWKEDPVILTAFRCSLAIVKPLPAFMMGFLVQGVEISLELESLGL